MVTWPYCFGPLVAQHIMGEQSSFASWELGKGEKVKERTEVLTSLSRACCQKLNFLPPSPTSRRFYSLLIAPQAVDQVCIFGALSILQSQGTPKERTSHIGQGERRGKQ